MVFNHTHIPYTTTITERLSIEGCVFDMEFYLITINRKTYSEQLHKIVNILKARLSCLKLLSVLNESQSIVNNISWAFIF